MQKISILLTLLGSISYAAQQAELTPVLKGVVLVDDSSKIRNEGLDKIEGIRFDGVEAGSELEDELTPFLSSLTLTADGAKELCQAITAHYHVSEDLRVAVSMPEQNTSEGVVQLVVKPERVGSLNVKNAQFSKPESVKRWVRLATSDEINEKTLAQDVGWINTNPFRNVNIDYQPGAQAGVTNVDLIVNDKKNWKVATGVDNTGTNPIGPIRIFGKLDINDFIFTDHTLNIQATTADHFKELQSYTAQYVAPLPWRNTVKIFGSYSETAPVRADFPQKHRENYQASGRYVVPHWFGTNPWIDQITVEAGFDFKGMNTNVLFEDDATPVKKMLAYVGQFATSVNAVRNRNGGKLAAGVDLVGSPARMLPHQTEADFTNLRAGATPQYFYSRLNLSLEQKLPASWKMFVQGRSQLSVSNLIPAEQFALGGYSTVRGYDEKVVNGDNAVCGNFEIRAPEFTVAGIWFPKMADSVALIGFVDAGYAWYREAVEDTPINQTLLGVGPGLRYNVSSYFTSRLDVGFPLLEVQKDSGKAHVHFNAILSY
jgi:hemolysin activation/secretion protein